MTGSPAAPRPLRLLFLCTGNSARSQIAEAVLNRKGAGRWHAESAGARPATRVNPYAIATLHDHGYDWAGRTPRGLDDIAGQPWDFVITVCDRAKEACPVFPGQPVLTHWGMPDPAEVEGSDEVKRRAFDETFRLVSRRIDLLLALPVDKLESVAVTRQVQAIGTSS